MPTCQENILGWQFHLGTLPPLQYVENFQKDRRVPSASILIFSPITQEFYHRREILKLGKIMGKGMYNVKKMLPQCVVLHEALGYNNVIHLFWQRKIGNCF